MCTFWYTFHAPGKSITHKPGLRDLGGGYSQLPKLVFSMGLASPNSAPNFKDSGSLNGKALPMFLCFKRRFFTHPKTSSIWWGSTHLKNMLVKLDHLPK